MTSDYPFLSGLLLDWPVRSIQRADLEQYGHLRFLSEIGGSKWEKYLYASPTPLRNEDRLGASAPFEYEIICRRSGSRILVLSEGRNIVEHLVKDGLDLMLAPGLRKVSIAVQELVNAIAARPTLYVLSFVHARVPAFGASLRSVSFYGDDLAEASLFRDQMELLIFFVCGLRRATGGPEIVRLGADGAISFRLSSPVEDRIREVEEILRFLRVEQYLVTDIWPNDAQAHA
jgi:hypothetical protein